MDAGLLSPDPERFGPRSLIVTRCHAMTPRLEVSIDDAMHRQETLWLARRLEPLHLPFSPSRRSVGVFSAVVQVAARAMFDIGQQRTPRNAITAQTMMRLG